MQDLDEMLGPDSKFSTRDLNRASFRCRRYFADQAERLACLCRATRHVCNATVSSTPGRARAEPVRLAEDPGAFNLEATRDTGDAGAVGAGIAQYPRQGAGRYHRLGLGYDKPDLAFVIHYQMPGSSSGTTSKLAVPDAR